MVGAALYFFGLFSGYLATFLLAAYILLFEENPWLNKVAVKALSIMVLFSFATVAINLIPNAISFIDYIVSIFGGRFYISFISNLVGAVVTALGIIEKLLLLGLGMMALKQRTIPVPIIDSLIDTHMG